MATGGVSILGLVAIATSFVHVMVALAAVVS